MGYLDQFARVCELAEVGLDHPRSLKEPKNVKPGPDGSVLVHTHLGEVVVDKNGVVRRAEGH